MSWNEIKSYVSKEIEKVIELNSYLIEDKNWKFNEGRKAFNDYLNKYVDDVILQPLKEMKIIFDYCISFNVNSDDNIVAIAIKETNDVNFTYNKFIINSNV